jgi:hypothetical protein
MPRFLVTGAAALLALAALAAGRPGLTRWPALPPRSGTGLWIGRGPRPIPAIVFVSRAAARDPRLVPGLGPEGRTLATGGRLLVREADGRLRELVARDSFFDVADPAVSFDARSVAFAATTRPDSAWRIWIVRIDGTGLRPLTRATPLGDRPARFRRFDDFDPCWIGERTLCFASTRFPLLAQYAAVPVSNLYVLDVPRDGSAPGAPRRITSERNGAEEPTIDPRRGEIVFARWWFSRFRAGAAGVAASPGEALPRDSVNLWEAVAIGADGFHLAAAGLGSRRGMMAYQPAFLEDGTPVGVYALNLGLWPRPGPLGIQRFPGRVGRAERVAGAAIPDSARDEYGAGSGLAAPSACAPAPLPDGRMVFAYSPGARGDFGIYMIDPWGRFPPQSLVDLPGTLELDPAPVVTRPVPWLRSAPLANAEERPAVAGGTARGTFTYHSLGVFRDSHAVRGAPARVNGAKIRFFAAPLVDAEGDADSVVLIREQPLARDGSIEARGLPADVPLFEQLVDGSGRVLLTAHGPAHVAGFNAGAAGSTSRCIGCHLGHSAIPLPAPMPATRNR